ncbi:hypothetical protein MSG28_006048 [Choristoneura fumiferana]|uniref:Uncharacterized protein n=1 Tax=Choristoneura fumiferana TaxID=7141 RepID=A0ACC0JDF9_CHOFU|nr:hypothetical protein MSG28_006048 [Choristoneura fumiferana]
MEKNASPCRLESDGDLVELINSKTRHEASERTISRQRAAAALLALLLLLLGASTLLLARPGVEPAASPDEGPDAPPVLVCYYSTPDATAALQPEAIPAGLCTHINVAFARVRGKRLHLEPPQRAALRHVVRLKQADPGLKVLLSVGGGGGDAGFSEMVADHASRKVFIKSIKSFLRNYTLDGIDLDWEFPAVHDYDYNVRRGRERQHFSQLLREIRAEYQREKRDYLLTVAVAAPEIIIDAAYDVDQLNLYADFVNVMTYDYHMYSRLTPFTGFNAPLFAERGERLYLATLNANYTVHAYLSRGLARARLVLGVPAYGHSFRLVSAAAAGPGAPASGVGALGARGFVDYADACRLARAPGAVRARDAAAAVPYLHRGAEWLSYDDERSVVRKAAYARAEGLRGVMVYSLNADDFRGACAPGARFPLVSAVRRALSVRPVT